MGGFVPRGAYAADLDCWGSAVGPISPIFLVFGVAVRYYSAIFAHLLRGCEVTRISPNFHLLGRGSLGRACHAHAGRVVFQTRAPKSMAVVRCVCDTARLRVCCT